MIRNVSERKRYLRAISLADKIDINKIFKNRPKSILIVGMKRIGDLIVILPAIDAIHRQWPKSLITIMSDQMHEQLLLAQPSINRFLNLSRNSEEFYSTGKEFDLIIAFRQWFSRSLNDRPDFPPYFIISTDILVGVPKSAHNHYLDALSLLGIQIKHTKPCLSITERSKQYADRLFSTWNFKEKDIIVAIHPGGSYNAKRWPTDRFRIVINWLYKYYKAKFIIVQGPGEKRIVNECIVDLPEIQYAILNCIPLLELAAVLNKCTFFLGNDTGIMHLADAVDLPSLTIFGPSRPEVWGATNPSSVSLVRKDIWWSCPHCSDRHLKDKPCNQPDEIACLKGNKYR